MIKQSMRGSRGAAKLNKKLPKICLGHLANSNTVVTIGPPVYMSYQTLLRSRRQFCFL